MKTKIVYVLLFLATMLLGSSCKDDKIDGAVFSLGIAGQENRNFTFGYGHTFVMAELFSNTGWRLTSDQPWCILSNISGAPTERQFIKITVERNATDDSRMATITMNAGGNVREYTVTQTSKNAMVYPMGMEKDAIELVKSIDIGWNLGNTLESTGGETAWGSPMVTQSMINKVKDLGFNAVRIPCSWNQYLEEDGITIQTSWMNRVKEVVDYCMNADMYAILNIHWDGGWMDDACDASTTSQSAIAEVEAKVYNLWTQIANTFKDYDEHLLFAGANEPPVDNREDMVVLHKYEQAFVNAVRATGGNNTYRNLIVQGPSTDVNKTNLWMELPEDPTPARMIVEVHYYDPPHFCLDEDPKTCTYFWGEPYVQYGTFDAEYQEGHVQNQFAKMKAKYVDKGIPLIIGEFGLIYRTHPDESLRVVCQESEGYFLGYVAEQAKNYGLAPFLWDTQGNGFFDRNTLQILIPSAYQQLMDGAAKGRYPF